MDSRKKVRVSIKISQELTEKRLGGIFKLPSSHPLNPKEKRERKEGGREGGGKRKRTKA